MNKYIKLLTFVVALGALSALQAISFKITNLLDKPVVLVGNVLSVQIVPPGVKMIGVQEYREWTDLRYPARVLLNKGETKIIRTPDYNQVNKNAQGWGWQYIFNSKMPVYYSVYDSKYVDNKLLSKKQEITTFVPKNRRSYILASNPVITTQIVVEEEKSEL